MKRLKVINTQGKYGAVKTSRPRKLNRVSGFRRDQMYTSVLDNAEPRNGVDVVNELKVKRLVVAYRSNHEKTAGDGPEPCSRSREYL